MCQLIAYNYSILSNVVWNLGSHKTDEMTLLCRRKKQLVYDEKERTS